MLEKALEILSRAGVENPQEEISYFREAKDLKRLDDIMYRQGAYSSGCQLMSNRLKPILRGDLAFGGLVVKSALQKFPNVPEDIVINYVTQGGGVDTSTSMAAMKGIKYSDMVGKEFTKFSNEADAFLYDCLRSYVSQDL